MCIGRGTSARSAADARNPISTAAGQSAGDINRAMSRLVRTSDACSEGIGATASTRKLLRGLTPRGGAELGRDERLRDDRGVCQQSPGNTAETLTQASSRVKLHDMP